MSVFPWIRAWVDCLGTFTDKDFVLELFFRVCGGRREPRTTWERPHFCFLSGLCQKDVVLETQRHLRLTGGWQLVRGAEWHPGGLPATRCWKPKHTGSSVIHCKVQDYITHNARHLRSAMFSHGVVVGSQAALPSCTNCSSWYPSGREVWGRNVNVTKI